MLKLLQRYLYVSLLLLPMLACTRSCGSEHASKTPAETLRAYLDLVFTLSEPQQKETLLTSTTGSLKDALLNTDAETFKAVYIDKKFALLDFAIIKELPRTPRETEITYSIHYQELAKTNEREKITATVSVTNTAILFKEEGHWHIKDVKGEETSIVFPPLPSPLPRG